MPQPDPERLAAAAHRAAIGSEHVPGRSNRDGSRILAFDILAEFIDDISKFVPEAGPREQIAWALLHAENLDDLAAHERQLLEDAWKKINDDADRAEWERLGLKEGNAQ